MSEKGQSLPKWTVRAMIGDSQSNERSTDNGSTAEGEVFHELSMPVWNTKSRTEKEAE